MPIPDEACFDSYKIAMIFEDGRTTSTNFGDDEPYWQAKGIFDQWVAREGPMVAVLIGFGGALRPNPLRNRQVLNIHTEVCNGVS